MRKLRLEVCHPQPSNAAPGLFQRRCLGTALSQTAEYFSSSVIPLLSLSHFTRWIWRNPESKVRGQLSSLSTNLLSKATPLRCFLVFLVIVPAMTIGHLIFLIPKSNFPFHLHPTRHAWPRLVGPTAACLANLLLPTVEALPKPCEVAGWWLVVLIEVDHSRKSPVILEMGW